MDQQQLLYNKIRQDERRTKALESIAATLILIASQGTKDTHEPAVNIRLAMSRIAKIKEAM